MARGPVEALTCDALGCAAELVAPASRLPERAEREGWQHGAITALDLSQDGPEVDLTDRCPAHPVAALEDGEVIAQAGGPGGLDGLLLAQLRQRTPRS